MKYISKLLILSTLFLGSCDILDKDIDTNLDKDDIFTDERFAQGFLNSTYRELINGFNRLDHAMFACFRRSDLFLFRLRGTQLQQWSHHSFL